MKLVTCSLHVDYVDRDMPDVVQTLVWQTYDQPDEFPRLVDQLNAIAAQEGMTVKNWIISKKGPLGPKQTHGLMSAVAS